jgi:hypothetical protein
MKFQSVPQTKQHFTVTNSNWLKLFKEVIAVCSENHMKMTSSWLLKQAGHTVKHWTLKG